MEHLIIEIIKYSMIILMAMYTYFSFCIFRFKNKKKQNRLYLQMTFIIFIIHFIGHYALYLQIDNKKLLILYGGEVIILFSILLIYQGLYKKLSKLILRNMMMLLTISFIIQTRLSFDKALKQVLIVGFASLLCLIVPYAIEKITWVRKYGWIYGVIGIIVLLLVLFAGRTSNGATNWLNIFGISVQPSEFVKILFVLSVAAMFYVETNFARICAVSVMAAANVLILVVERDLGGALIFFVTYFIMLYVATSKSLYLFAGLSAGSIAAYVAYHLFYHVRVRVMAWQDPFRLIDNEGYQISQSLFAIGTGGWLGMGINQGLPTSIPVVDSDFVFSAISEEFGGFFALCIILIYINCFVLFISSALELKDNFYRLVVIGYSTMFAFQVFLSIGGVTKFIPSTGVTLPFLSSGGSSVLATILMFMILQGVYRKGKLDVRKEASNTVVS